MDSKDRWVSNLSEASVYDGLQDGREIIFLSGTYWGPAKANSLETRYRLFLPERLLICINPKNNNAIILGDGEMDSIRKGINWFHSDIIITYC
jgi:hypothetical protein